MGDHRAAVADDAGCGLVENAPEARAGAMPNLPFGHVPRQHLVDFIVQPYHAALTLIIAEAGAGKTTLAAEWARQAAMPVAWVTLDEPSTSDAEIVAAFHRAQDELTRAPDDRHRTITGTTTTDLKGVIAAIRATQREVCLVVDNWELASQRCADLIEHVVALPDLPLRLILVGRDAAGLRLGRLRSLGRVRAIGGDHLRLTDRESGTILRSLVATDLPPREVARVTAAAEGWVAGVVLQGLAIDRSAGSEGTGDGTPRSWEYIDEYVEQEMLAHLAPELRGVALSTAWLPWVGAEVADVILDRSDSAPVLEALAVRFPFLRDDPEPGRYRYHPLVRESLCRISRSTLPPELMLARARRAAEWFIDAGELEAAARIALDTGAPESAQLIEPWCRYLADRSDFERLGRVCERMPESVQDATNDLAWWRVLAWIGSGRRHDAIALADAFEARVLPAGDSLQLGRVRLARGWLAAAIGRDMEARGQLAEAIERLPADAHAERMYAFTLLGETGFRDGRDSDAAVAMKRAEACAARLPLDERWSWFMIAPARANGYALRGDLHSAITKYRLMLAELPPYLVDAGIDGFLRCRLVSLYIERNDVGAARRELEAIEASIGDVPLGWHRDAMLARARVLLAEGRRDEAEAWATEHLSELRRLPGKNQMVSLLARIWMERGEFPLVESWLNDIADLEQPWIQVFGDINHRVLTVSLHLARGRFDAANRVGGRLASEALAMKRWSELIALSVRWAIALEHLGDMERGREVFRDALARGANGGFVRALHVPGFDVASMFADIWTEQPEWQAIRRDLQHIYGLLSRGEPVVISPRELEVLRHVAEGRTNQQIADSMFISTNTVRNHLVRIGQRLEAGNRQESVARARGLGLLS